jgi:hypothetical protein
MKINKAIVVGVGGTGTHLVEALGRLLSYHPDGCRNLALIDGDSYEEKNSERQLFDASYIDENKAAATGSRLDFLSPKVYAEYVNQDRFGAILSEFAPNLEDNVLIIASVDNERTRHEILNALEARPNCIYISPGNERTTGHSVLWAKTNGVSRMTHPFERYENIRNPTDQIPGFSCQEEAVSFPQLIIANAYAAVTTLNLVQNILDDKPVSDEIVFCSDRMVVKGRAAKINLSENIPEPVVVVTEPELEPVEVSAETEDEGFLFDNY